jgi:hypothetical protein
MEHQNIETLELMIQIAAYKIIVPLALAIFLLIHAMTH